MSPHREDDDHLGWSPLGQAVSDMHGVTAMPSLRVEALARYVAGPVAVRAASIPISVGIGSLWVSADSGARVTSRHGGKR